MILTKNKAISTADFEYAISKAFKEVEGYKHATEAAKDEMRKTLDQLRKKLVVYKESPIEVPEFMR